MKLTAITVNIVYAEFPLSENNFARVYGIIYNKKLFWSRTRCTYRTLFIRRTETKEIRWENKRQNFILNSNLFEKTSDSLLSIRNGARRNFSGPAHVVGCDGDVNLPFWCPKGYSVLLQFIAFAILCDWVVYSWKQRIAV